MRRSRTDVDGTTELSSETVRVRIATDAEDFERFRELAVEYENSLDSDLRHREFERELQNLSKTYGPPNAALIATVDDAPAGCVALVRLAQDTAVVKKLYVRPEFRGFGLARKLMAGVVEIGRSREVRRLVLDTDKTRLRAAYELYLSLGFRECEPYGEVDYRCPTFMDLPL